MKKTILIFSLIFVLGIFLIKEAPISKLETVEAQQIELACPAGTAPWQPLVSRNPNTGGIRQYACVDANGNITLNGGIGGLPGGSNSQFQYNSLGTFAGSPAFTFNGNTSSPTITINGTPSGGTNVLSVGTGGNDVSTLLIGSNTTQANFTNANGTLTYSGATVNFSTSNPTNPSGLSYRAILNGTCTMASGTCNSNAGTSTNTVNCWAQWNGTGTLTGIVKAVLTGVNATCTVTSSVGTDTAQMNIYWLGQ